MIASIIVVGIGAVIDAVAQAASGVWHEVPVAAWGAIGAVVAGWLGYLGTTRSRRVDALTEWREWAEDFRESERECHQELAKVQALAEQQRRQLIELGAELDAVRAEVVRLSRQIHGEEPL